MKYLGTIRTIPHGKTYAFIHGEADGKSYFFHQKQLRGTLDGLRVGDKVQFEIVEMNGRLHASNVEALPGTPIRSPRVVGPYVGPDFGLSDQERLRSLTELARWKLEAKLDDIKRYFFAIPE